MNVEEATRIIHSLSEPSKMPGYGYGLPTAMCITGSKLRDVPNSVCSKCYACKGHYSWRSAGAAQRKRYSAIHNPLWVMAMITALKNKKVRFFRWHDSGDLQSVNHLKKIIKVAEGVPDMLFWLPTKEYNILRDYFKTTDYVPPNLCIRLSATMIDSGRVALPEYWPVEVATCSVHDKKGPIGFECEAYERNGKCGECRTCWDYNVRNVSYRRH